MKELQWWAALQWATRRCQSNNTENREGQTQGADPAAEKQPGTATQAHSVQKAKLEPETRSRLQRNGLFPSIWKASDSCGKEENSHRLWQGRAREARKQVPPWNRKGIEALAARRGRMVPAGQALAAQQCLRKILLHGTWQGQATQKTPKKRTQPQEVFWRLRKTQDPSQGTPATAILLPASHQQAPAPHSSAWPAWGCWCPGRRQNMNPELQGKRL